MFVWLFLCLWSAWLVSASTCSSVECLDRIENVTVDEFLNTTHRGPMLVLFTELDCHVSQEANCNVMRDRFIKAIPLYEDLREKDAVRYPEVRFVNVHDHFVPLLKKIKLDNVPRLVYYEEGSPVNVKKFATSKQNEFALLRFLLRMLAKPITEIKSENDLNEFLYPSTDLVRDSVKEDTVSFIHVEPEPGSFRSRALVDEVASEHRAKLFFGHVRMGLGGDWQNLLNLSVTLDPPSLVRMETGVPSKVLLNGYSEFFGDHRFEKAVARYSFPLVQDFAWYNYLATSENEFGIITVVGLYRNDTEREIRRSEMIRASKAFPDVFLYGMFDRVNYEDFLRQFVDDDSQTYIALDKSNGTFYLKEGSQPLLRFLEKVLAGSHKPLYERGVKAIPRLFRKAVVRRPILLVVVAVLVAFAVFIILYCSCGLRSASLGLDSVPLRDPAYQPKQVDPAPVAEEKEEPPMEKDDSLKKTE